MNHLLVRCCLAKKSSFLLLIIEFHHMKPGTRCQIISCFLLTVVIDKVSFRINQINDDSMIDYVIVVIRAWACTKIHSVGFARFFDLLFGACQTNDFWVEFLAILLNSFYLIIMKFYLFCVNQDFEFQLTESRSGSTVINTGTTSSTPFVPFLTSSSRMSTTSAIFSISSGQTSGQ